MRDRLQAFMEKEIVQWPSWLVVVNAAKTVTNSLVTGK